MDITYFYNMQSLCKVKDYFFYLYTQYEAFSASFKYVAHKLCKNRLYLSHLL